MSTADSIRPGRLSGKVAFITGAGAGIGAATAARFIEEGAEVAAVDLNPPAPTDHLLPLQADMRDQASLDAAVEATIEHYGRIDILFANAGVLLPETQAEDLDEATWNTVIDIDLSGVWRTAKAVFPALKQNPNGSSVILASSTAGIRGGANSSAYTAAKTALVGLAKVWATELGAFGGRVNTTHPTAVGTDLVLNDDNLRRYRPDLEHPTPEDVIEPFKRGKLLDTPWIDPIDVANAVLFLASDEARYITGTNLVIDAGSTTKWG
ncbi:SDR family oxidoreductase [Gulosibacter molinativorax]|uniref:SDR family oxidoreductase n=1 Tax=Gulosibacter molinativorax TaxID=256821 RepID=A0ABT7C6G5_9MICO|nr:SDR family oxidoreductase [Gulosibacter molinativorax]MDJ1370773.1 SDR family oxidoreductase [Gulosibacter molinativorax]QUY63200.1 Carveol dehydrogenase [Gulosibacter molinativorax]